VSTYNSLIRVTQPAVEPVTLAEAKSHLRVDSNDSDAEIMAMVQAAREWVETYLDRTLVHTQWAMRMEELGDEIDLPRPPVATASGYTSVSVTYTLPTGETTTLPTESYRVDRYSTPGEIYPPYASTWPPNREDENAVVVTWWGGYGASGKDVPASIRHAILMLIGFWFENRSSVLVGSISKQLEFAVESLLSTQKWGSYR